MPRFRITFDDGSSIERDAATPDQAKLEAKNEARSRHGAAARTDPRVKVRHLVNLDEQPGPTDPRTAPAAAGAPTRPAAGDRERPTRDTQDRDRDTRGDQNRDTTTAAASDRERQERWEREDRERHEREDRERAERDRRNQEGAR